MPITLEQYLNIRAAYAPTISPDGRRVAFIATITGVPQVWVMDLAGGWPDPVTSGADRVLGVTWSPIDDHLIFSRDAGGDENTQLFLVKADGSGERRLTNVPQAMHLFGAWSDDGCRIAYAANRRDPSRYDIYIQDLDTGTESLVWRNDGLIAGYFYPAAFAPGTGDRLLLMQQRSSMNHDLYELALATGSRPPWQLRCVTMHAGEARFLSPAYAPGGRAVFCASDLDRNRTTLSRLDLDIGHLTPEADTTGEVQEVAAAASSDWLAWAENVDGRHVLWARNLVSGATLRAPLPGGVVYPPPADMATTGLAFGAGAAAEKLVFAFTTPTRTADIWLWDLATGKAEAVTRSSHAGLPPSALVEPELIHYPSFDGRQIPAWFYRAGGPEKPAQPRPVVVYVHGGPEGQTQAMLYPILQYLVYRGYHVLAPNVRGSSGYGREYLNLDNVERRPDSVADLAHAALWLRQQPEVDPNRLAVYGASYGGFMVLAAITRYPELWAAAVDVVGIANFVTFLERTGPYRRAVREAEYGSLAHHRALLEKLSPIHQVDQIRAPLFVIHGRNDPRVPLAEAEQIVSALRARQAPVEFLVYDDEGHGLVKLANKLDAYPRVVGFLDRHLMTD